MDNRCVCCGEIIPEGRQVCPNCENGKDRCQDCSYKAYYERVASQNDCNACGARCTCQYVPRIGSITRINCPLWRPKG